MHTIGNYKGNPTISLSADGGGFPFTFGVEKAHLILENLEAIRQFAEAHPSKHSAPAKAKGGGKPTRNELLIDHGYNAVAREEGAME